MDIYTFMAIQHNKKGKTFRSFAGIFPAKVTHIHSYTQTPHTPKIVFRFRQYFGRVCRKYYID